MAKLKLDVQTEDEGLEPHEIELTGPYQSDPGDLPDGVDWRSARWHETIRFVAVGPWDLVNGVIRAIGVNSETGAIMIAAGVDLTRFMVGNAIDDDKPKMRALLADPHKVIYRADIARICVFLVEQYSGGKASTISGM